LIQIFFDVFYYVPSVVHDCVLHTQDVTLCSLADIHVMAAVYAMPFGSPIASCDKLDRFCTAPFSWHFFLLVGILSGSKTFGF